MAKLGNIKFTDTMDLTKQLWEKHWNDQEKIQKESTSAQNLERYLRKIASMGDLDFQKSGDEELFLNQLLNLMGYSAQVQDGAPIWQEKNKHENAAIFGWFFWSDLQCRNFLLQHLHKSEEVNSTEEEIKKKERLSKVRSIFQSFESFYLAMARDESPRNQSLATAVLEDALLVNPKESTGFAYHYCCSEKIHPENKNQDVVYNNLCNFQRYYIDKQTNEANLQRVLENNQGALSRIKTDYSSKGNTWKQNIKDKYPKIWAVLVFLGFQNPIEKSVHDTLSKKRKLDDDQPPAPIISDNDGSRDDISKEQSPLKRKRDEDSLVQGEKVKSPVRSQEIAEQGDFDNTAPFARGEGSDDEISISLNNDEDGQLLVMSPCSPLKRKWSKEKQEGEDLALLNSSIASKTPVEQDAFDKTVAFIQDENFDNTPVFHRQEGSLPNSFAVVDLSKSLPDAGLSPIIDRTASFINKSNVSISIFSPLNSQTKSSAQNELEGSLDTPDSNTKKSFSRTMKNPSSENRRRNLYSTFNNSVDQENFKPDVDKSQFGLSDSKLG